MNTINNTDDIRYQQLSTWLTQQITKPINEIIALPNDASFRRYFRICVDTESFIAMDAPPDKEDSHPFVGVATVFKRHGIKVPNIFAADLTQGFLLLSDFGDTLYSRVLTASNATQLYQNAITVLPHLQTCQQNQGWHFPSFGHGMLMEELSRFREWYLLKHLNLALSASEETMLTQAFATLINAATQQPQVCVHRDYHSRNLIAFADNSVGVLDFQDAVWGPITYDLVSLIRDCYVAWPDEQVQQWLTYYWQLLDTNAQLPKLAFAEFKRYFDWMGIQRHLKAIYIFARKFRRDNNANYLGDIPRALNYIVNVTQHYTEFALLNKFLQARVLPYESDDTRRGPWSTSTTLNRHHA